MHELSIAVSIVDECSREARSRGSTRVNIVYLKLGPLSGVVADALLFSYGLACEGTPLAGSRLEIEEIPVVIYCPNCQVERVLKSIQQFCCPVCGSPASEVIMGRELQIVAMEIEDACPQLEPEPAPV